MDEYRVWFQPGGRRGPCRAGQSLLECARDLGVGLVSVCGGKGTCGRCKVQILSGPVSEPTANERQRLSAVELQQGYRLACQAHVQGDCRVIVPPESLTAPQRMQIEGAETPIEPDPVTVGYDVSICAPSLGDLGADADRLCDALRSHHGVACDRVDIEVLRQLSPTLRSLQWQPRAWIRDGEIVALTSTSAQPLGLAVDLGTTKIACYLLNLDTGETLAAVGLMNPQISYGEDVISRLAYAQASAEGAARLQELAVDAVNKTAAQLCAKAGADARDILEAVVVGNTAMHHLLLGLPVAQLGASPYVPAVARALDVKAREAGLDIAPGGYLHTLPNVAGFVGADHVAMLLATGAWQAEGLTLAVDIGTNTEVCLISNGEMVSASCASGPAFEGAHITHGMRAAAGAIEHIHLADDQIQYQTIGHKPPVGLCGSGILDALAQLYLAGIVDRRGKMGEHPRVRMRDGQREFVFVSEEEGARRAVSLTQKDVRELQLAKGAIRTGIQLLLEAKKRSEEEIERVIIAGAFGTYIDVASAVAIGMFPNLPLDRFTQVGNAAGIGAKMALASRASRMQAQRLAEAIDYVELAAAPNFMEVFARSNYLG